MIAIVVAAGASRRMGFDKLCADLAGKPLFLHSLLAFEACAEVEKIVLVAHPERCGELAARCAGIAKLKAVVPGGAERHLSVWNGILAAEAAPEDFLAVADAARPLVTPAIIAGCLRVAKAHGAAACAAPVADTLKKADAQGALIGGVERDHLWSMQTPQIFRAALLKEAYEKVLAEGRLVTDEVSAVQLLGVPVFLSPVEEPNFKVTHPRDLELARMLKEKYEG